MVSRHNTTEGKGQFSTTKCGHWSANINCYLDTEDSYTTLQENKNNFIDLVIMQFTNIALSHAPCSQFTLWTQCSAWRNFLSDEYYRRSLCNFLHGARRKTAGCPTGWVSSESGKLDYLNFCSAVPSYSYGAAAAVSTLFPGAECKSLAANLGESIRHPPVTCFNNYLRFHALKCEHKSAFRKIFDKIQPDILHCLHPACVAAAVTLLTVCIRSYKAMTSCQ